MTNLRAIPIAIVALVALAALATVAMAAVPARAGSGDEPIDFTGDWIFVFEAWNEPACDASLDAALVLQLDAGFLSVFPCDASGDASLDGAVNSIDATIILQIAAGMIMPLPATGG